MKKIIYITLLLVITLFNSPSILAQSSVISLERVHIPGSPYPIDTEERKSDEASRIHELKIVTMYLQEYDNKSSFPVYLGGSELPFIQYNNISRSYLSLYFDKEYYTQPPLSVGIYITINRYKPHEYLKLIDYGIKVEKKFRKYLKSLNKKGIEELSEEDIEKLTINENQIADILKKSNKRVEKFIRKYNIEDD